MTAMLSNLAERLTERRERLGMSYPALAERSGVSEPTVKRVLAGRIAEASFENVAAIAEALGMPLTADPIDVEDFREQAAREKAERVARLVQGTSALEAQAVDADQYRKLVERSMRELLTGSRRLLWAS
ncbi:MAG: XRE family transcriptional regulator [Phycisphaerales bacterium]|nr:MAG: XRE family transcriptional regulator [Phycisphaerales bacterium]